MNKREEKPFVEFGVGRIAEIKAFLHAMKAMRHATTGYVVLTKTKKGGWGVTEQATLCAPWRDLRTGVYDE